MNEERLVFKFDERENQRLDHFLVGHLPEYSRSRLQTLILEGKVTVDGKPVKKTGVKLEEGQSIEIVIPPNELGHLVPENIPLDIIYEDNDVIVVNKPSGMVVHPSAGHARGTLVHAVLGHAPDIEGVGGEIRPGLVHRLDKDTSGIIILAKNDLSHRFLQKQFKNRVVKKNYFAIVDGHPPTREGRVEAPIGRDPKQRQKMAVLPGKGREAISEFRVAENFTNHSLMDVQIMTGRTHQIRVHMAFIGCPVLGDPTYGLRKSTLSVPRQMLHAARLEINLPGSKDLMAFSAPLPEDFNTALDLLRD